MMMTARKNGSALLIVLGFLSFMVVSAVAFAIYMRAERLPSSALRRNVATRHLVKAALAEAISRVEDSVRGDPFPGVCRTNQNYSAQGNLAYRDGNGQCMDVWCGRVFMPPDAQGSSVSRETRFAPASETVSVLTLEALGYLPPCLVNDVRFLSRGSWAAQWQQLPFDSGRFAYCAVNVSDFFDVNRLYASRGRTSEAMGRISLGYLFDSSFDPTADPMNASGNIVNFTGDATTFDNFVHESRPGGDDKGDDNTQAIGNTAPYVSMLDYNLALGSSGGSAALMPLFYDWIAGGGNKSTYYIEGSQQAKSAARQPFVTESVSTNEYYTADISTVDGQPFRGMSMASEKHVQQVMNYNSPFFSQAFSRGTKLISPLDYLTLYDYLDHDDVPISLAMPSTERVPMIAAIEQTIPFVPTAVQPQNGPETDDMKVTYYDVNQNWFQPGVLSAVVAFPFKHGKTRNKLADAFKIQALVRVFLAPPGISLRPGNFAEQMRPKNEAEWNQKEEAFSFNGQKGVFMVSFHTQETTLKLPDNVEDETEAFCTAGGGSGIVAIPIAPGDVTWPGDMHMLTKMVKTITNPNTGEKTEQTSYQVNIRPFIDDAGSLPPLNQEMDQAAFTALANIQLVPYVAVWLRIVNSDGTVDLVPAYPEDDQLNGGAGGDAVLSSYGGSSAPLLRFMGSGINLNLGAIVNGNFAGGTPTWEPRALYTVDPRFNWAPESWYGVQDQGVTFEKWVSAAHTVCGNVDDGRDEDIFMFTSNQGILQSLGEFAFLPRLCENGTILLNSAFDGQLRSAPEQTANINCAWRSYPISREWYNTWAELGVGRSVSQECLVNPFTDNRAIMMGALANTPVDYWAAARAMDEECLFRKEGTQLVNTSEPWYDKPSDVLRHAFCSLAEETSDRMAYKDVTLIAERLMSFIKAESLNVMEQNGNADFDPATSWEYAWDNLPWEAFDNSQNNARIFGIDRELENGVILHSVDRKFLYSYWRDCFANKQQLFLIFVRAESNALGGPGEGTPAQQGGRAVALVWRNPSATRNNGRLHDRQNQYLANGEREPHQTRILFFHQFD